MTTPSASSAKPTWRSTGLVEADLDLPWFCAATKDYKTRLALIQKKLGKEYQNAAGMISQLLGKIPEERQIRRFSPKNERVLAYHVAIAGADTKVLNYLLIVGAEVSTKPKSMAYADGQDHYNYQNCYYVLCAKETLKEEKFGKPVGQRIVRGHRFQEYETTQAGVQELVLRLLKMIMAKENAKPE